MKLPAPKKNKNGTWTIRLFLGGKYHYIVEATELSCKREAMLFKAKYQNGEKVAQNVNLSLTKAIDNYIAKRDNILSPSTINGYRNIQRNRLKKYMGMPLKKIDWQEAFNDESAICSSKTVANAYGLITSVAKENGITIECKIPQVITKDTAWLTPEQIPTFLEAMYGNKYELYALLALNSLRKSEILALKKDSIHDGIIEIKGSVVDSENGMVYKETNKSSASRRTIPILIPRISELVETLNEGNIVEHYQSNIAVNINRVCERNGLPKVGLHGLRRSFASLAYHLQISERDLMLIGGWNDRETVHKHYIKLSEKQLQDSANKFKDFYKKDTKRI